VKTHQNFRQNVSLESITKNGADTAEESCEANKGGFRGVEREFLADKVQKGCKSDTCCLIRMAREMHLY